MNQLIKRNGSYFDNRLIVLIIWDILKQKIPNATSFLLFHM